MCVCVCVCVCVCLCVCVYYIQQLLKMAMDNGNFLETITDELSKAETRVQVEPPQHAEEKPEDRSRKACPFEKVARDADDENEGWKIKLLIFVGGTSGSVNVKTFNDNLTELQAIESNWNAIRKCLAFELLNAQDAVQCSYFAQRAEARGDRQVQVGDGIVTFQGLGNFKCQTYLRDEA
jgi:hypothetical protein